MKKKIKDLIDDEIIELLGEDVCKYCCYETVYCKEESQYDCPKKIVCFGADAIYPRCVDDDSVYEEIAQRYRESNNPDTEIEVEE